jgi:hypothetical protein
MRKLVHLVGHSDVRICVLMHGAENVKSFISYRFFSFYSENQQDVHSNAHKVTAVFFLSPDPEVT